MAWKQIEQWEERPGKHWVPKEWATARWYKRFDRLTKKTLCLLRDNTTQAAAFIGVSQESFEALRDRRVRWTLEKWEEDDT